MKSLMLVLCVLLCGCVANAPFRTGDGSDCPQHWGGCGNFYEKHKGFDVGFVEYTERGNDFNPAQTNDLLELLRQESRKPDGLALVVFIHGWKHNASTEDPNVQSFVEALGLIQNKGVVGKKKLIGIYVGWRGMSLHGLQSENLTFWDRKATAEEVGRGGVTKLLLDLEYISKSNDRNFMMTIGHSFGGAIVLSALHDVLLYKMVAAENGQKLMPFGDGVILLNPAIEANQALLLKESSMRLGASYKGQPRSIMHVISSRADMPTNFAFPMGQFLGVTLTWDQKSLRRKYGGQEYLVEERSLDQATVGNYGLFTTGSVIDRESAKASTSDSQKAKDVLERQSKTTVGSEYRSDLTFRWKPTPILGEIWTFESFCAPQARNASRMPCYERDPIDFISVPKSFISDHVDVFNINVVALLSAVVEQSYWDRTGGTDAPARCRGSANEFSFGKCFAHYLTEFSSDPAPGSLLDDLFKTPPASGPGASP